MPTGKNPVHKQTLNWGASRGSFCNTGFHLCFIYRWLSHCIKSKWIFNFCVKTRRLIFHQASCTNLSWFTCSEDADFMKVTGAMVRHCKSLLGKIKLYCPQFTLDGYRNVWIVKPGAKSRGRGKSLFCKMLFPLYRKRLRSHGWNRIMRWLSCY